MNSAFAVIFVTALAGGLAAYASVALAHCMPPTAQRRLARLGEHERAIDAVAYLALIAFALLFSRLNIGKYDHLLLDPNDFGLFDQVIWNSLHGRLFENTFFHDAPILLGQRFAPILLALVPVYAIASSPHTIALVPPIAVAFAALPLYWFARDRLGRPLALVFELAYLMAPVAQSLALSHFYETKVALPILMLTALFLLRRQYAPFLACLAVALLCKEEMGFVALAFGIYILIVQRRAALGVSLILFSVAWTGLLLLIVIPHFQGGTEYYYLGGATHSQYYGYLGNNLPVVASSILTRPDVLIGHVLIPDKIDAVLWLLLPIGLLPLLGAEVAALAIPTLGYTLLSDIKPMYIVGSHHYAPVLAFIYLGSVVGVERGIRLFRKLPAWRTVDAGKGALARWTAAGFLLGAVIAAFWLSYSAPTDGQLARDWYLLTGPIAPRDQLAHQLARMIPQDAAVLSQDELTGLVAERRDVYRTMAIPCYGAADYFFLDQKRPWYGYRQGIWDGMLSRPDYMPVAVEDGYIVGKRAPLDNPMQVEFDSGRLSFLGYTLRPTETVSGGQSVRPIMAFRANSQLPASYALNVRVIDSAGHLWAQNDQPFCGNYFRFDQWRPGALIVEPMPIQLPPTMPGGSYVLSLELADRATDLALPVRDSTGPRGDAVALAELPIRKDKQSITAGDLIRDGQLDQPYYVDMGSLRLLGFKSIPAAVDAGDALHLGLFWRAREKPDGDYTVAVQMRDNGGRVILERASRPANNTYPTTDWDAGEVLLDWHDVAVPLEMAAGEYQIVVTLQDLATSRQLGEASISTVRVQK